VASTVSRRIFIYILDLDRLCASRRNIECYDAFVWQLVFAYSAESLKAARIFAFRPRRSMTSSRHCFSCLLMTLIIIRYLFS